MTEESRKLYLNGVQAVSESRWEAAHAMFLAARALHPHYTIAGNLGDCELHLGRYREAAENLALYVRELKKDATSTAEERARGAAAYAEARAKVGAVVLQVNVERAAVLVDGVEMGKTPLVDPLFVEPGTHTVAVEHDGYVTEEFTVHVGAGGEIASVVTLRKPAASPPTSAPAPAPVGGAELSGSGPRTAVLIGGAAAAGAAAVAGVVFTILAVTKSDEAETQRDALVRENGPGACSRSGAPAACSQLSDTDDAHIRSTNGAILSFAAAGAIGAGTAIYWLTTRPSEPQHRVRAMPVVGASGFGLSVSGEF
ncbi:PEGA domain-containing protein [Sorangium sp. So ce216]